jgi:hypothetical protein
MAPPIAIFIASGPLDGAMQIVRRITANRSPQSGQPAKFLLIRRESLTDAPT